VEHGMRIWQRKNGGYDRVIGIKAMAEADDASAMGSGASRFDEAFGLSPTAANTSVPGTHKEVA
jgi:hypothetical protein